MSRQITRQVQKSLLESSEGAKHIRCPKPDSLVCKTGYSSFDRTENYGRTKGKLEELREI
jgi:hypothetical protein